MPKLTGRLPKYRKHKASGQAVVTLNGRDFYLGPYGSKISYAEYDRLTSEWLAAGRTLPTGVGEELTIAELLVRYFTFVDRHYRHPDGRPTQEVAKIEYAIRLLRQLYSGILISEFGPLKLKTIQGMLAAGYVDAKGLQVRALSRPTTNERVAAIKRLFSWAVSEELAPPSLAHALATVRGLQRGRCAAREPEPVRPVDDETVDATLPHLPSVLADMVRFQRLVGCRPSEVCNLRPCDIDRSGKTWVYEPSEHKTAHHGHRRRIFVGPRAQAILAPYLLRDAKAFCFAPVESEQNRLAGMRAARKTKVQPSQRNRRKKKPRWVPGGRYTKDSYRRAVARACELAFPPPDGLDEVELKAWRKAHTWSPNRLRHSAATEIRRKYGLEAAQVVLGHSYADVTQIYAERDGQLAEKIMGEMG